MMKELHLLHLAIILFWSRVKSLWKLVCKYYVNVKEYVNAVSAIKSFFVSNDPYPSLVFT